jgi:hypothetical protein
LVLSLSNFFNVDFIYLSTGMRPYPCPFCERSFNDGSNRRKHKLKDHPLELAAYEAQYGKGKIENSDD